ncbi:MAG: S8 family serine peptidase [Candidatus Spechtbacterales bacterium]|nr:S8 family serine peptidase [Candidatus Spechtbacterales bacterium]
MPRGKVKKYKQKIIALFVVGGFLVFSPSAAFSESITPVYPDDIYFYQQRSHYDMIKIPEAWSVTTGGDDIVVAIIDNGIDMQHPDLKNNIWYNRGEVRHNGIDDDGNGYIDDYYGYDFSLTANKGIQDLDYNPGTINIGTPTTLNEVYNDLLDVEFCIELFSVIEEIYLNEYPDEDPVVVEDAFDGFRASCDYYIQEDPDFNQLLLESFPEIDADEVSRKAVNNALVKVYSTHGTPVSSLVAARGNNQRDFSGVLWNAKIMNLRFFELWKLEEGINQNQGEYDARLANAVRYAVDNGADVINMSLGMEGGPGDHPILESALKYAYDSNVPVVVAAGNYGLDTSNTPYMPACSNYTLTIGSVDTNHDLRFANRSGFSNYGSCVDVAAPGWQIPTLYHGLRLKDKDPYDLSSAEEIVEVRKWYFESGISRPYRFVDGTSFSSPLVAGVVGLLLSEYPNATTHDIYTRVKETAVKARYRNNQLGAGTVDAYAALTAGFLGSEEPAESSVDTSHVPEGALIRAHGDVDVYIVKYVGNKKFKRLVLSPTVFNSYGHLRWEDIMDLEKEVVDSFETSNLVRATVAGDPRVYQLFPQGDTGEKRWVKTAEAFDRMGFDWDAIYTINEVDRDSYIEGSSIE